MNQYLCEDLEKFFTPDKPLFNQIMGLQGECFREQNNRLTQRIALGNKTYFIKQHKGVGWREIFKNLLQGRWPVLSALNEWRAIQKLQSAGLAVPHLAGYGKRGMNPAQLQSYILMEELTETVSLEDLCKTWKDNPPSFTFKLKLISKVAEIARTMHELGVNHRDFYLCHFLFRKQELYLIDLHRAQIRNKVPLRWRMKDLAGLYFSSKDIGLTKRDILRFMRFYSAKSLRKMMQEDNEFWQKIEIRGEKLYRDHQ